jgi:hypothetical protein
MLSIQGIPIVAARIAAELKSEKAIATLQKVRQRRTRSKSRNRRPQAKARVCK